MKQSEQLKQELLKLINVRNVVGFSKGLRKRIKDGVEVEEEVIKIYVNEKMPEACLRDSEVLPKEILGIPVDVVEKKQPSIFLPESYGCRIENLMASSLGNTGKVRPLLPGTSIGNYGITAGTLGWYAVKDGVLYVDSNAHVFHNNPNSTDPPSEMNIVQPGKYDGGTLTDRIGEYKFHISIESDAILPSTCPVAKSALSFLNTAYIIFNRRTRFTTYVRMDIGTKQIALNNIDYAVAKIDENINTQFRTFDFEVVNKYKLVGKLFAGSEDTTIGCKVKYQLNAGYKPFQVETADVLIGDTIRKSGRTTGDTQGEVSDASAVMKVSYGNFNAIFDDVFILGPMSAGGDSGSSMWKLAE